MCNMWNKKLQRLASGEPVTLNRIYVPDFSLDWRNFNKIFDDLEQFVVPKKQLIKTPCSFEHLLPVFEILEKDVAKISMITEEQYSFKSKFWESDDFALAVGYLNDDTWAIIFYRDEDICTLSDNRFLVVGIKENKPFVCTEDFMFTESENYVKQNLCYEDLTLLISDFKRFTKEFLQC